MNVPSDEVTEWAVGIFSTPYDSRILSHRPPILLRHFVQLCRLYWVKKRRRSPAGMVSQHTTLRPLHFYQF